MTNKKILKELLLCVKNKLIMKLNYFDLGLHKDAVEIDMFIDICKKNKFEYNIYGFEAHPEYCNKLYKKYENDKNVKIINKAISNNNGLIKLYISEKNNGEGNSIFKTKINVNANNFITIESIKFSDWIKENIVDFKENNNILRFNIEGAEWHLINDLNDNNLLKYFKIILGSKSDIRKVGELVKYIEEYDMILKNNNICVNRFTKVNPKNNCDLLSIIKKTFSNT
jgi:FkbM family methyltransferase